MPCYFILAERSIPMGFRSIGIVREIRPLAIGGIVLAAMGVIFFIAAFIRAWRSLKQGEKEKGGPEQ